VIQREDVEIEAERFTRMDSAVIEMASTEDEWAGPVTKPARPSALGDRLEDSSVVTGFAKIARPRFLTVWHARDTPKNYPERSAQNVGGFAGRKENRFPRTEFEAQRVELECHRSLFIVTAGAGLLPAARASRIDPMAALR
jgi:hypothetical protein